MFRWHAGSALWVLGMTAASPVSASEVFNRIASFPVPMNLPADRDQATETSAEIIAATADGMTLVYTDSPLGALGFIDITDPNAPAPGGIVELGGEPTSVAIQGGMAFASVNSSRSYTEPSGHLAVVDIAARTVEPSCNLGGQPDAIAISHDGSMLAIAIENERDEEFAAGVIPQLPAGNVLKKIAVLMGGDIRVKSREEEGSTFMFSSWVKESEGKDSERLAPMHMSAYRVGK